jgi:S1-C subfamily serine protease
MIRAGFKVERDPSNLFEQNTSPSDLEVAGQITAVIENLCYPLSGARNLRVVKGSATIDIEWQVYSHVRRAMLARIRTTGEYRTGSAMEGANNPILLNAFSESVRRLAADGSFRKIFLDSPSAPNAVAAPEKPAPLDLPGAIAPGKRAIGDAVGSVVVIFAGDGHGSGALVSRDGYILTAQHVVGDAKFVKIRWSDGFETVGEVVRWAKARDIALVKSDAHGRQPLSLNLNPMQPGDTVFAIGAPLDAQFQSTVTRGIVSANRVIDGFAFIQSDVMVNHGNSGGPLLDENGAVVGFTDLGYRPQDIPTGLNLFIPTRDAIDFLNLKPKP